MLEIILRKIGFSNLGKRPNLFKILKNAVWLFADKIVRMGAGIFVGVQIARYLGPDQYGLFNYVLAFSALFGILGTLSLDNFIIKELLTPDADQDTLLGTAFVMRLVGSVVGLGLSIWCIYLMRKGDTQVTWLMAITSASFVYQSLYVIDFYFQAHLKSKYSFIAQNSAFIVLSIVKIVLLIRKGSLQAFVIASSLEFLLAGIFFIFSFKYCGQRVLTWRYSGRLARKLLKESYPLILSGFAVLVYTRLDQVMLGQMLNDRAVGIYSAAVKISEVWYFIPIAIASSLFPSLIRAREESLELYTKRLQQAYDFMAMLGLIVSIGITFVAHFVIVFLYGHQYAMAANILSVSIWTGALICISTINGRWLLLEGLQFYTFMYTVIGAVINFVANLFFIRRFGAIGAAYGTLLAQTVPVLVGLSIKKLRGNTLMMLKSLIFPFRYLKEAIAKSKTTSR